MFCASVSLYLKKKVFCSAGAYVSLFGYVELSELLIIKNKWMYVSELKLKMLQML